MKKEELRIKHFLEWVTTDSLEGPIPFIDALTLPILKSSYIALRVFFKLLLGRQRRNKIHFLRKFWLENNSPSYMLMVRLNRALHKNKDDVHLLKIHVPKEHYQYFCRIGKGDFLPGHEGHIVGRFTPKEGDIVIDIGAHIGRYTITSSKQVGNTGKVVAIEADPDNFELLKRNIALNNLTNVLPLNYAAFSTRTRIKLYEQSASAKYNSVMLTRAAKTKNYVEVNADTLDSILKQNGINQVNWIKIDVEGAEYEVLKGSTEMLSGENVSLLVEIHNIEDPSHYYNIVDFLKHRNYEMTFEQRYEGSGESHIIFRKKNKNSNLKNL
ncbi:MAG TPA: FkbM family methyltransferase [Nitrososphaeraceae archaeon]|nr:FkbM family methyltransferase [Nitrososphaeraceae archaeon]